MLLVRTKLGVSDISGIGLFADEFIAKDTCVWKFMKGFDMRFDKDYPTTLPELARRFFLEYASQNPDTLNYSLDTDNARFMNHADAPNTYGANDPDDEDAACFALRDINKGEEITADYRKFNTQPFIGFGDDQELVAKFRAIKTGGK